jgi:multiple sugar transport system permease protein
VSQATADRARAPATRRGMSALARRDAIDGYLFILPWILGFLLFTAGPMLASLGLVFVDWDLLTPPTWAGTQNVERLWNDRLVGLSLFNTGYYTFLSVPLRLVVALAGAMLLNASVRGLPFFRTAFYLPAVLPLVGSAILWLWLMNPQIGLFNMGLSALGLPCLQWLWDPALSKPSLILISLWTTGNVMVIFLAGLQAVPQGLYEAAEIDGAGWWGKVRHVTVPMMTPYLFLTAVLGVIGSFQVFTSALLVTGGGPANATLFVVLYLFWNGWSYFKMGYASAMAWVLLLIILAFTALQFRIARRWVYYEADERK